VPPEGLLSFIQPRDDDVEFWSRIFKQVTIYEVRIKAVT
jgi:hypothetical protein